MVDDLPALFRFNRWADDRILAACRELAPADYHREPVPGWPPIHATLVHLAGSTSVWARRFHGETGLGPVEPDALPTLDAVAELLGRAHDDLDRLVADLTPDRQAARWTYRNFRGETSTVPLWAALRHVVNHATYHRGQVAAKLGRLGARVPETDLVRWAIEVG